MRRLGLAALILAVMVAGAPAPAVAKTPCAKQTRALKSFKRARAKAKRKFFKAHKARRARKAFLRRQRVRLRKLRRARKRCLAKSRLRGPASKAITDLVSEKAVVGPRETTDGVVRTQLELELTANATRQQYAAVLDKFDAVVVSSVAGVLRPTVRIPDPGSLAKLRKIAADMSDEPGVVAARTVSLPLAADLPSNVPLAQIDVVRPQLAARASAAWNARGALASPPTLLMADYFGNGAPGSALAVTTTPSDFSTPASPFDRTDVNQTHGYLVSGLAAAAFDTPAGGDAAAESAAGIWPGPPLPLRVVDLRTSIANSALEDRLVLMAAGITGNIVISLSIEDGCNFVAPGCTQGATEPAGIGWADRLKAAGLLNRVLVVSAAGNERPAAPGNLVAEFASSFNWAALKPLPNGPPLPNALVVENVIASPRSSSTPIFPLCRNSNSKIGGHISAVGTDVSSLDGPATGAFLAGGGTSSATPQVAAAAAAMWAARPAFTAPEIAERLKLTARAVTSPGGDPRCDTASNPAPVLDVFAALLSADVQSRASVTQALFDFGGGFNDADLATIDADLQAGAGAVDYSATDFNGDGRRGGPARDRFDLSHGDPPTWEVVRRSVLGIPLEFDERALTDYEILCFAVNGGLFTGTPTARDAFSEQRCLPPVALTLTFPATIPSGAPQTLSVHAVRSDTGAVLENLPLELSATGGTVATTTGQTSATGDFTTTATPAPGASQIDITVKAKVGSTVLDQEVASATVSGSTNGTVDLADAPFNDMGYDMSAQDFGTGDSSDFRSVHPQGHSFSGSDSVSDGGASANVQITGAAVDNGSAIGITASASGSCGAPSGDPGGVSNASAGLRQTFTVSGGDVAYTLTVNTANSGDPHTLQFYLAAGSQRLAELNAPGTISGTIPEGTYNVQYNGGANCDDEGPTSNTMAWDADFSVG